MGAGASSAGGFASVEAALAAGKTQEEIDEFLKQHHPELVNGSSTTDDAAAAGAEPEAAAAASSISAPSVIVAIDGSRLSFKAFTYARRLIGDHGTITLLHATDEASTVGDTSRFDRMCVLSIAVLRICRSGSQA